MKLCNYCNTQKQENEFYKGKSKCKDCSIHFYKKEENYKYYKKSHKEFLIHLGVSDANIPLIINGSTKINHICKKNHNLEYEYDYIKKIGLKCKRCTTLIPYYELKNILENEGYILLTNEDEFKGASVSKISFECEKGHVSNSKCSHIRGGTRCKLCSYERLRNDRITPIKNIHDKLKSINYEFIEFKKDYKNRNSKLKIKCDNGHMYETTVGNIMQGCKCNTCYIIANRGENHPSWKGGRRTLYHQLRSVVNKWREDSLSISNYTCYITNDKKGGNLVVHHPFNFYKIIDETLFELNIPLLENIGDYDAYQLLEIEKLVIEKHYNYGYGIVMRDDIHKLFHKLYGNRNNNLNQVYEFKDKYLNGEYHV